MEKHCTLLIHFDKETPNLVNEIKEALEGNDIPSKMDAMKKTIMLLLNGYNLPHQIFITIVRYVFPSEDHTMQKLLLLYFEIIKKTDYKGKVLPEMILVCQNLRNNLIHPNEYIRGITLRFLCRLKETEIIEPLIPCVLQNLKHRQPYVRKNVMLAVMSIYNLQYGDERLVDAPEMIEKALTSEQDPSVKRNVFLMLCNCAPEKAICYLITHENLVADWNEMLQMVVVEVIRKVFKQKKEEQEEYILILIALMNAPSAAVRYESASALVSLASSPIVIMAATDAYFQLLQTQSDHFVKFTLLERLNELKPYNKEFMVEMIMEVLRLLLSPDSYIQRKTLDIAGDIITPQNVEEVVLTLKEEAVKTKTTEIEKNAGRFLCMSDSTDTVLSRKNLLS